VLWVRSYFTAEGYYLANSSGQTFVGTTSGIFSISSASPRSRNPRQPADTGGWKYQSKEPTLFLRSTMLRFNFVMRRSPATVILELPCWVPVLVLSVLASMPYIPRLRFTLRTLLIATTLVAVGLGLIVWAMRS
jgi:hypothetical protein